VTARGQQAAIPVIGYLSGATESANRQLNTAFRRGLGEQGYTEGRNLDILFRYAEARYDRLPALAEDLVRRRVAAIFVMPTIGNARIAKNATATIPIVFALGGDPVAAGLVASLNRPGANITGIFYLTVPLIAKRLEVLHQIVPAGTSIGYLSNPINVQVEAEAKEAETAARTLGIRLVVLRASTPAELDEAFTSIVEQRIAALLTGADSLFYVQRDQLVALAARYDPRDLMRPFPAELMKMWPISTRVNKPENDDPSIVEPIELVTGTTG
jgi:putative ABC transport system substrate-binding protein